MRTRRTNSFRWLFEPLEDGQGYMEKPMFGCLAAYLHGRLVAVAADREEPWNGLLVPTGREHHESLMRDFKALRPHPVLGKWLFLNSAHEDFEDTATALIEAMSGGDPRLGVEPKEKKKKGTKKNAPER